jgi:hypothetical protein
MAIRRTATVRAGTRMIKLLTARQSVPTCTVGDRTDSATGRTT